MTDVFVVLHDADLCAGVMTLTLATAKLNVRPGPGHIATAEATIWPDSMLLVGLLWPNLHNVLPQTAYCSLKTACVLQKEFYSCFPFKWIFN